MKRIHVSITTALAISLCFCETSQARTISSISPPTGPGQPDTFCIQVQTDVNTPFPNNDNSTNSGQNIINNFPGLSCTPITFQTIAPIDTQLFVEPSGGTTEYLFSQTVVNNTNSTWNGFNISLGFGASDNFAVPELILVPAGFAIPNFNTNAPNPNTKPSSSKFTQLLADGSFNLQWLGGSVAPGESVDFRFSLDVPDDLNNQNFYNSFTIRQLPIAKTVPEPTSTSSLLGFLGLISSSLFLKNKLKYPVQN